MAWLIAKWKAKCYECDAEIREGDDFVYNNNKKYCEDCGKEIEDKK